MEKQCFSPISTLFTPFLQIAKNTQPQYIKYSILKQPSKIGAKKGSKKGVFDPQKGSKKGVFDPLFKNAASPRLKKNARFSPK